jgi:hypothetical protein
MDKLKMSTPDRTDKNSISISSIAINDKIFVFREFQVMIDKDLAELYGVETKRLNEQVKRNIERFPEEFRFQLTKEEKEELVANCDRFESLKHSSSNPFVFTEQGVAMLSAVLHSKTAIDISVKIMKAFVEMRNFFLSNAQLFHKINSIELTQIKHIESSDKKFKLLFDALERGQLKSVQGIFYEGQIFDAYKLISDIFKTAQKSIIIIDNYLDDTVLTMLEKKKKTVSVELYSKNITEVLKQAVKKFNEQHGKIFLKQIKTVHDRFIIIDRQVIYHFGASLKDTGKKVFAFSKLNIDAEELLKKL